MARVAPTFFALPYEVTDHSITLGWRIDGDTPMKCIVAARPDTVSPTVDVQLPQTVHTWSDLPSGTLLRFSAACVYPDGDIRWSSADHSTTGVPPASGGAPSSPVTGLRVTANDANGGRPRVRLEWDRIDSRADGLILQRFGLADGNFVNVFDVTGEAARSMTAYEDTSGLQLVTPYRYGLRTYRGTPGDARLSAYATAVVTTAAPPPAPMVSRWQQPERIALLGQFGAHPVSAVVARGTQRVDAFVMDGDARHTIQHFFESGGWRTADLGAFEARSRLAAASWGLDRVDLFYRGADDRLKQRLEAPWAGGWTGEVDLGGRMTSAAAAVSWGPNRLDVFYRGQDGHLIQRYERPGVGWSGEVDLGGRIAADGDSGQGSAPAVASRGPDLLDVFYRSPEQHLIHRFFIGASGWSGEVDLGTMNVARPTFVTDLTATAAGRDRLDVFYLGNDAQYRLLQHSWHAQGNTWTPATTHDGTHGTPMVASRGPGTLDLLYGSGVAPNFLMRRRYAPQ
ncbi:hypothetical protein ACF07V_17155 [Streptomyces sp. NPDC015661]|uniref:hypothetical protein n=1 Tax=Streptomyces sp. NPDC015661 TaxID=3364961 RepID=UPI0036FCA824